MVNNFDLLTPLDQDEQNNYPKLEWQFTPLSKISVALEHVGQNHDGTIHKTALQSSKHCSGLYIVRAATSCPLV